MSTQRHIAHIVYRFGTGGLENGIVNLINRLPAQQFRHSIICLNDFDPEFAARLVSPVHFEKLNKKPGPDWKYYPAMWHILRRLKPDIVHTRNISTLEYQLPAALAGIKYRIHGEHGWDMADLAGHNNRYVVLKRALRPLVHNFIALSSQSHDYLLTQVKVSRKRCHQIINGVDTVLFTPEGPRAQPPRADFFDGHPLVFGSVGRLATVKNHSMLVNAFIQLCKAHPSAEHRLRLILVGDGEQRCALQQQVDAAGLSQQVWLAGNQQNIPAFMRLFDLFVLPSLAEGISNTILEAMACGLPVIATRVGGNPELVSHDHTGKLVECTEPSLMQAMDAYYRSPDLLAKTGKAARHRVMDCFSLDTMVARYRDLYHASNVASG
jgi:sugar transferase (PEP-CTERM/EpsH1 system associated)